MSTKRDEIRDFIRRESIRAVAEHVASMSNREDAEVIRRHRTDIAIVVAWQIADEYRFLELADIMEWKKTRVRR